MGVLGGLLNSSSECCYPQNSEELPLFQFKCAWEYNFNINYKNSCEQETSTIVYVLFPLLQAHPLPIALHACEHHPESVNNMV